MDAVRAYIETRLAELGLDYANASREIGKNAAYIQQFLKRGSPRVLPEDVRKALAKLLQCSEDDLKEQPPKSGNDVAPQNHSRTGIPGFPAPLSGASMGRTLPVFGRVHGGSYGIMTIPNDDSPIEWTYRPPQLESVEGAFATYVFGDTMKPAYENGDLAFVHPHQTPKEGNDVLVVLSDDEALIKRLVSIKDGKLELEQFCPAKNLTFPLATVRSIRKIVGRWNG